ncbi:MAG: ferrochelatase, partial [Cyanobacteria bacterium J06626_14]
MVTPVHLSNEPHDHHDNADSSNHRVAVLLMGYGEVESYDDFANYNEQALN